ncbi:MAG: hypothetical protein AAFZ63_12315 [Bacteroidota bacterium]
MKNLSLLAAARALLLLSLFLTVSTTLSAQECETQTCECEGDITEMVLFYSADQNADIFVYRDQAQTQLVGSYLNRANGDQITVSAAGLPGGTFPYYLYFRIEFADATSCTTRIFSECPPNAWPGSTADLDVLGKSFANLTVFSYTSSDNGNVCDLDDIEQDWHVGGNFVGPENMALGTRNAEAVELITDEIIRGVITATGSFGIGTVAPTALLDVEGDVRIATELDVFGDGTFHSNTSSTNSSTGAVVVTGGIGISENANIGANLDVDGTGRIANDFTVESAGITRLQNNSQSTATNNGALIVAGGAGIARNANIGENLVVGSTGRIGNDFTVQAAGITRLQNDTQSTSSANGALIVTGGAGIGRNTNISGDLTVEATGTTSLESTVQSNSTNTGSLVVEGGVGVGRNVNIGENLDVQGVTTIGTMNTPVFGGTNSSDYHLFVAGGILTEEVLVRTGWADYVFEENYPLTSLEDKEAFIEENGHLPAFPAAAEIEENGLPLAQNAVTQQVQIEEIYLHLIEMNKTLKALESENQTLRERVKELEDSAKQ